MSENKILLAGFEQFGPYSYNVAESLVDELNGEVIDISNDIRLHIMGIKLPINFDTFREVLAESTQRIKPSIAVGLGMDFKDLDNLALELSANSKPQYGTDIKDEKGQTGDNKALDELTGIIRVPNESKIKQAISQIDGIKISENAGRHMCETILRDLIRLSDGGKIFQPAFIHLPHTPDLLAESANLDVHTHSMPLEQQREIVRTVVRNIGMFYL